MAIASGSKVCTTCIYAKAGTQQHKHLYSLVKDYLLRWTSTIFSQIFVPFKNVHGIKTKEGQRMCLPRTTEATLSDNKWQMLLEEESFSINVLSLMGGVRDSLGHTLQAITGFRRSSDCESQPETESLVSVLQDKWKLGSSTSRVFPQNEVTAFHCIKLLLNQPRPDYRAMMEREAGDWEAPDNHWVIWKLWALSMPSSGFQGTTLRRQKRGRARRSPKATTKILSRHATNLVLS